MTPLLVKTGDIIVSDGVVDAWLPNKYDLSKMTIADLRRLLQEALPAVKVPKTKEAILDLIIERYGDIYNGMVDVCRVARLRQGRRYKSTATMTDLLSETEEEESEEEEASEDDDALEEEEESEEEEKTDDESIQFDSDYLEDASDFEPLTAVYVQLKNDSRPPLSYLITPEKTTIRDLRMLMKCHDVYPNRFRLFFPTTEGAKQIIDDHRFVSEFITMNNKTFYIVPRLCGGAPEAKRGRSTTADENPFAVKAKQTVCTEDDLPKFEFAYAACLKIGGADDISIEQFLINLGKEGIHQMCVDLKKGKARHTDKVRAITSSFADVKTVECIHDVVTFSLDKLKRGLASGLWQMGCDDRDVFSIDILIASLKGFAKNSFQQNPPEVTD